MNFEYGMRFKPGEIRECYYSENDNYITLTHIKTGLSVSCFENNALEENMKVAETELFEMVKLHGEKNGVELESKATDFINKQKT